MAARILDLPDELLLEIISDFLLWDLQSVAITCRRFRDLSYAHLQEHKHLKRTFYKLDDHANQSPTGWLSPLVSLLKGEFPPSYTEVICISYPIWYWPELPVYATADSPYRNGKSNPYCEEDMQLVIKAIEASPWIHKDTATGSPGNARDRDHFIKEVRQGDQDNILALLLPLLPNLQRLQLPGGRCEDQLGSVPAVFKQIAEEHRRRKRAHVPLEDLPLSKLSFVCTADRAAQGHDLNDLYPFMIIPSVKKVDLFGVVQPAQPNLPEADALRPNAHEYLFTASIVEQEAAMIFAKTVAGPCTIENNPPLMRMPHLDNELLAWRWARVTKDELEETEVLTQSDACWMPPTEHSKLSSGRPELEQGFEISLLDQEEMIRTKRLKEEKQARNEQRNHAALLPLPRFQQ